MSTFEKKAKLVENQYRPIPFWSWNDRLTTDETVHQIRDMNMAGIGGYFMHSRGGLITEYMGEEWHDNIRAAIDQGELLEMRPWIYDEDGWPSGFGGGIVSGMGEEYQLKYLRIEKSSESNPHTITHNGEYHLYYDVNRFYVDMLDPKVVKLFLDSIYENYSKIYGTDFEGFFTDEPQVARFDMPWSLTLPSEYQKKYGDDLLPHLHELFYPEGDYKTTRFRFWKLITDLFSEHCMKQMYDYCHEREVKLTGHLLCEETLTTQILSNGAIMPHYEYFDIPGMDWLGRPIKKSLTPWQVSAVAHQLGKSQVLSETFAGCGHNVGHDELKALFEWQMVHGITLLCQHLAGYSMRGLRKRDYPPALNYQSPWWNDYRVFNDTVSRIGKLLTDGEVKYDTLLIHPQSSAWVLYDYFKNEGLDQLNDAFIAKIDALEAKHILFHLGDETIMERHARVEGASIVIGTQRYTRVVLPEGECYFDSTEKLLLEYIKNGGIVTTVDDIPANPIIDNPKITFTERVLGDEKLYYFVNTNPTEELAFVTRGNRRIIAETGDAVDFDGYYKFAPYESILVCDDGASPAREKTPYVAPAESPVLDLSGEWNVKSTTPNAMTLDICDYWFDGELIEEDGYVLSVMQKALALERPVHISMRFKIDADFVPQNINFVCETPELYTITCNGKKLAGKDEGYLYDRSFRKIDLEGSFKLGRNIIELEIDFKQNPMVYEKARQAYLFEVEKNRFKCDTEIEACYLCGDFGVEYDGEWTKVEHNAALADRRFRIVEPRKTVELMNLERQGYLFFAGSLTLSKKITAKKGDNLKIKFKKYGVNVVEIKVNGNSVKKILWAPYEAELGNFLVDGENEIEITLTNNLRNLLGPLHSGEELLWFRPGAFQKEPSFWNKEPVWFDNYCFVEVGLTN